LPMAVGVLTSTMIPLVRYGDNVHYIPYRVYSENILHRVY
jgi:hypothetical protein